MTLTLTPETEALIQQEMRSGRFRDPDEAIATAFLVLRDYRPAEVELAEQRELLRTKLDESFAAAARGDSLSAEEFLAGLDAWKAEQS
jgi:Arc/MetJ-type ribon-helix-helix transcriptional regulator